MNENETAEHPATIYIQCLKEGRPHLDVRWLDNYSLQFIYSDI